jgi:hypothetical protein
VRILAILLFSSFFGCSGQDVTISSIERKVYVSDSLFSSKVAHFKNDGSELFANNLRLLKERLEKHQSDSVLKRDKYVEYSILFSDSSLQILKLSNQNIDLDNYMLLSSVDFNVLTSDTTFDIYFWNPEAEVKTIVVPSSEFHK